MVERWICEHGQEYLTWNGLPHDCWCNVSVQSQLTANWVRLVRILRTSSDTGVGDTIQRIASKFGGERFKQFAKRLGIPCGCTSRQEQFNRLYPY